MAASRKDENLAKNKAPKISSEELYEGTKEDNPSPVKPSAFKGGIGLPGMGGVPMPGFGMLGGIGPGALKKRTPPPDTKTEEKVINCL